MSDVTERVLATIKSSLKRDDITIDSNFDEIGVDSLAAIELLFEVEEEFDIDIPDRAAHELRSVRDIVTGVEKLLAGGSIAAHEADA